MAFGGYKLGPVISCSVPFCMTEFGVYLPSDASLAESSANSQSDIEGTIPGWSRLVGEWEADVTGFTILVMSL